MSGCACMFPDCNGPTDYVVEQGADWTETLSLVGSSGSPLNLTGATAVLQARAYPGKPAPPAISLSSTGSSPAITLGGAAGTVTWTLPGAQTALLVPALNVPIGFRPTDTLQFLGFYDLVVTLSTGAVGSYSHGKLLLLMGISNIARPDGEITLPVYT